MIDDQSISVNGVMQVGAAFCLEIEKPIDSWNGEVIHARVCVDHNHRKKIESHHTATHLMHWALHQSVSSDVAQQGSLVDCDRLRFDFNSEALSKEQILVLEDIVNEKIKENDPVSWREVQYESIKDRSDIMQFFGDKYGDIVRIVQIGGNENALDGYSMELCGGTHLKNTGEIGLFKIKSEGAISAGVRRIEAVCGEAAQNFVDEKIADLTRESEELFDKLEQVLRALDEKNNSLLENTVQLSSIEEWEEHKDLVRSTLISADKKLKKKQASQAAAEADGVIANLVADAEGSPPMIIHSMEGSASLLQELMNGIKKRQFNGVSVIAVIDQDKVHLGVVSEDFLGTHRAGELIAKLAPIVGGKGGGKPEMARGAGNEVSKVSEMLSEAEKLIQS